MGLRNLIWWLGGRQERRNLALVATAADPVYAWIGERPLLVSQVRALQHHHSMGLYHHEQMEAREHSCCAIFGVDPDDQSMEADWCREIVSHHTDPEIIIERLACSGRKKGASRD